MLQLIPSTYGITWITSSEYHAIAKNKYHALVNTLNHAIADTLNHGIPNNEYHALANDLNHGLANDLNHGLATQYWGPRLLASVSQGMLGTGVGLTSAERQSFV